MDDYRSCIEGFDPSAETATGENFDSYVKQPIEIKEYSETPHATISEPAIKDMLEETVGGYMLPKKVIVKTYKLKKI